VSAEAEAVERECYGTADDLTREMYGMPKRRPATKPARPDVAAVLATASAPAVGYRVTSHARVLHDCGRDVYTESVGFGPASFPAVCWYCGDKVTA
jgi:hypothetical protein